MAHNQSGSTGLVPASPNRSPHSPHSPILSQSRQASLSQGMTRHVRYTEDDHEIAQWVRCLQVQEGKQEESDSLNDR